MVRTDSKVQKLDAFLQPSASSSAAQSRSDKASSSSSAAQGSAEPDDAALLTALDVLEPCDAEDPQTDSQPRPDEAPPRWNAGNRLLMSLCGTSVIGEETGASRCTCYLLLGLQFWCRYTTLSVLRKLPQSLTSLLSRRLTCYCLVSRKRPHVEEVKEDLTAASLPRRRIIKLSSINELREDIEQQTHKGSTISTTSGWNESLI